MVLKTIARKPSPSLAGWPRLRSILLALFLSAALASSPVAAQRLSESEVKAAYLFNFGKFLRLPDAPGTPRRTSFDICVLGQEDIVSSLVRLTANEQYNGLPERALKLPSIALARNCAILFLGSSEASRIDEDLAALADSPVLTVSDMPQFLHHGGMIEFELLANHVRFSVSLDPVAHARLGLSSELLKVALSVTGTPRREGL